MVRCVRVSKRDGESVRNELMNAGLLDLDHRIASDGDSLLIPITTESFKDYPVVDFELVVQEHKVTDYRKLVNVPEELVEQLPGSFDVIGDVAILKLVDELLPYKEQIGKALMDVTPNLRTVMLDSGVKGELRIRELVQIAGTGGTETIHKEFGVRIAIDPSKVYFNPRLATERSRIASDVKDGEVIIDMFAGVAPFGTVICKTANPEIVYSIDLNEDAEPYVHRNIEMNHITNLVPITGDATVEIVKLPKADRVVMNLPQMADQFLEYALGALKPDGVAHLHKIIERAEFEDYQKDLISKMKEKGFDMRIIKITELKTYSPTMSVYVLDVGLN